MYQGSISGSSETATNTAVVSASVSTPTSLRLYCRQLMNWSAQAPPAGGQAPQLSWAGLALKAEGRAL